MISRFDGKTVYCAVRLLGKNQGALCINTCADSSKESMKRVFYELERANLELPLEQGMSRLREKYLSFGCVLKRHDATKDTPKSAFNVFIGVSNKKDLILETASSTEKEVWDNIYYKMERGASSSFPRESAEDRLKSRWEILRFDLITPKTSVVVKSIIT